MARRCPDGNPTFPKCDSSLGLGLNLSKDFEFRRIDITLSYNAGCPRMPQCIGILEYGKALKSKKPNLSFPTGFLDHLPA